MGDQIEQTASEGQFPCTPRQDSMGLPSLLTSCRAPVEELKPVQDHTQVDDVQQLMSRWTICDIDGGPPSPPTVNVQLDSIGSQLVPVCSQVAENGASQQQTKLAENDAVSGDTRSGITRSRQEEQRSKQEEQDKVDTFLKEHGFKEVNGKKRVMWRSSYPLHIAAREGNAEMVRLLLEGGADASFANNLGQTPEALARKNNLNGSHQPVLIALKDWIAPPKQQYMCFFDHGRRLRR